MNRNRRHPVMNVATSLLYGFRLTLLWYWLVFTIIFVAINVLLMNVDDAGMMENTGIWLGASMSPKIFLLVIGILLVPGALSLFVSNGITRKHFIAGASILMAILAAACSILLTTGFPIEKLIYSQLMPSVQLNHPNLLKSAVDNFFLCFTYFGCGMLIGAAYYRFNWRIASLLCLLALLPAIAIESVIGSGLGGDVNEALQSWLLNGNISYPFVLLLAIVVSALTIAAGYLMIRNVPIRRKLG